MPGTQPQTVRSVPPFFKAVSEGVKEFQAICVVGGRGWRAHRIYSSLRRVSTGHDGVLQPGNLQVILAVDKEHYAVYTLKDSCR